MKTCIYQGSIRLVEKSGVGRAIHQQIRELQIAGSEQGDLNDPETAVVHINTAFPDSVAAALKAKRHGKKVIWYGHSTGEDFENSFRLSNGADSIFRRWLVWCYAKADAIITPTEYSRDIIRGYGLKNPIYVLSNGVDTDFFKPDPVWRTRFRRRYFIRQNQKVVISVGHYMVRKGIIDFIDLASKMPDTVFIWFGHTGRVLITKDVIRPIDRATPNVLFPGYASREELCDACCGSDLFCFMSHEETEGIVVLEALASGIPVLVRDIPVYHGWLRDGESVYKACTQDEFLKKAEGILSGELPDLTAAGRRCAEERSLENIADQLAEIHRSIVYEGQSVPVF